MALLGAGSAVEPPAEFALLPVVAGQERLTPRQRPGRARALRPLRSRTRFSWPRWCSPAHGASLSRSHVNAASFVGHRPRRRRTATSAADRHGAHGREPAPRARDGQRPTCCATRRCGGSPSCRATGALLFISASLTVEVFYVIDVLGRLAPATQLMIVTLVLGMIAGALGLAAGAPPPAPCPPPTLYRA